MAIDPKELRVGSHVDCKGSRYEVCGIYGDRIALIVKRHPLRGCESAHFSSDYISPIPITEDILAELGFEYRDNTYWERWFKGGFEFERKEDSKYFDYNSEIRLEYLHELENLYYMIYRQELIND